MGELLNPPSSRCRLWMPPSDIKTGELLTNGPSNYQIPTVADVPKELNVTILDNSDPGPQSAIYSSKVCRDWHFTNF